MTNFSHGEADGIRRLPYRWQRTIDSLGVTLKACKMLMCFEMFSSLMDITIKVVQLQWL